MAGVKNLKVLPPCSRAPRIARWALPSNVAESVPSAGHKAIPTLAVTGTCRPPIGNGLRKASPTFCATRSEEHTSELQSRENLVCRLLLEKKNASTDPY